MILAEHHRHRAEAIEHPARHAAAAFGAGRDRGEAGDEGLERRLALHPSERGADAGVDAVAEGDVALALTLDVEGRCVLPSARIPIGRGQIDHHPVPGLDCLSCEIDVLRGETGGKLCRSI